MRRLKSVRESLRLPADGSGYEKSKITAVASPIPLARDCRQDGKSSPELVEPSKLASRPAGEVARVAEGVYQLKVPAPTHSGSSLRTSLKYTKGVLS